MAENKIFTVATAHLDTVWRWELPKTINEFLPDTFEKNLDLIEKYPNYNFNLEGAFRYELIEEYYPQVFEEIKKQIENGRCKYPLARSFIQEFPLRKRIFQKEIRQNIDRYFSAGLFRIRLGSADNCKTFGIKRIFNTKIRLGRCISKTV